MGLVLEHIKPHPSLSDACRALDARHYQLGSKYRALWQNLCKSKSALYLDPLEYGTPTKRNANARYVGRLGVLSCCIQCIDDNGSVLACKSQLFFVPMGKANILSVLHCV